MTTNRAEILTPKQIDKVVVYIRECSELMFLLSHLAGLRVSEIVKLDIDSAFLDVEGRVPARQENRYVTILATVGKKANSRVIPMHPRIADAIKAYMKKYPKLNYVAFAPRKRRARASVPNITVWFWSLYRKLGMQNCSSHSGRRTFATRTARVLNDHGQSLRDLQVLMGHSRMETTQVYIEPTYRTHNMIMSL
jgi:integrase